MSDVGGGDGGEPGFFQNIMRSVRGALAPPISGLDETKRSIEGLNKALDDLQKKMEEVNRKSSSITSNITTMLGALQKNASTATTAVSGLTSAVSQLSGGNMGGGTSGITVGSTASPQAAVQAAASNNSMRSRFTTSLTDALGSNIFKDIAMYPLRLMRSQISNNRELALATSMSMGGQAFATGMTTQDIMRRMAGMPGSILGSPEDQMALFQIAREAGAMMDFGQLGSQRIPGGPNAGQLVDRQQYNPRAAGFLRGVREMQYITPGASVAQMATTLGGYTSNIGAQQQAQFLTGGAFAMIGAGGQQKSLSQWAESILRWLEGLRPGRKRGKPFDYGELMSQYFPGSNIDAWFTANQVPQNMREYWWSYALNKAKTTGTTGAKEDYQITAPESDLAYRKLRAGTAQTISGYNLAGQMAGAYSNREQANQWFNEMYGQILSDVIPAATATGPLRFAQALPENIEELFMTLMENTGAVGAVLGGALGYGGFGGGLTMLKNITAGVGGPGKWKDMFSKASSILSNPQDLLSELTGDVGDVGDYGPTGGTTTAGLHPDVRKKINRMMQANPRIRVTSGLRDLATQQKLRRKGYNRVSGRPSAHTRGLAADLGPKSEYPWIVANASRFGLKSGNSQGEPWHVGIGDPVDDSTVGNANVGLLKMFMDLIGGGTNTTPQDTTNIVGQMVPAFFNLMLGVMGKWGSKEYQPTPGSAAYHALEFRPTQFAELVAASKNYLTLGGLVPSLDKGSSTTPNPPGDGYSGTWPAIGTREAGMAVARAAHGAGFTGENLVNAVAISKRESGGWDPNAFNGNLGTGDRSFGLWQINMLAHTPGSFGFGSEEELYDPNKNAHAAMVLFRNHPDVPFYDWGPYKGKPATYSTDVPEARSIVQEAGLIGDVDYYMAPRPRVATGTATVFNNSFIIQGGSGPNMGIDARRVASLLANHLEEEMRQRMARSN